MKLTQETLFPYQGFHGIDGLCHVRVYEQPGRLPVVIAVSSTTIPVPQSRTRSRWLLPPPRNGASPTAVAALDFRSGALS